MKRRRGFSLVETLVASALAVLVVGPIIWLLVTAFRVDQSAGIEMDLTAQALRVFRRTTRDITASRGVVRFDSAGRSSTLDGLQMKSGHLLVYERRNDGSVWRLVFGPGSHSQLDQEYLGEGFAYFHLLPLDRGIHVALELERQATAGAALGGEPAVRRLELSTVVVARGW